MMDISAKVLSNNGEIELNQIQAESETNGEMDLVPRSFESIQAVAGQPGNLGKLSCKSNY